MIQNTGSNVRFADDNVWAVKMLAISVRLNYRQFKTPHTMFIFGKHYVFGQQYDPILDSIGLNFFS